MARDTNGDANYGDADGKYDGSDDDDDTANDGNDADADPDDGGGMMIVVVMGNMLMMGMLLLLLKMSSIIHWLLSMWRKFTNALFFLYNNSIEHLLETGQLNTKLESHLALSQTPTFLWDSPASLRSSVVFEV